MSTMRDAIDAERQSRGLSVRKLALLADVPYDAVRDLLRGKTRAPRRDVQAKLLAFLGLPEPVEHYMPPRAQLGETAPLPPPATPNAPDTVSVSADGRRLRVAADVSPDGVDGLIRMIEAAKAAL